jgi:predicted nucleic acid-binding protein
MIHGLDTSFLVAADVSGHPDHSAVQKALRRALLAGDTLALAPQVLAEFVHVVTDPRRFERPLSFPRACDRAELWWHAEEVVAVYPRKHTLSLFFNWLREHALGRKRLLDTLLAATYLDNDVNSILTTNARDFRVFGSFDLVRI